LDVEKYFIVTGVSFFLFGIYESQRDAIDKDNSFCGLIVD